MFRFTAPAAVVSATAGGLLFPYIRQENPSDIFFVCIHFFITDFILIGAGSGDRTRGLRITKPALCRLSYASARPRLSGVPAPWPLEQSPMTGLKPVTSHSWPLYQLSYIDMELEFGIEPKACAVRKHRSTI